VLEDLSKIAAINPAAAARAPDEMPRLIRGRLSDALANVFPAGDTDHGAYACDFFGGSLCSTSSGHKSSISSRICVGAHPLFTSQKSANCAESRAQAGKLPAFGGSVPCQSLLDRS
jgi:hypothetical protein